MWGHGQYHVSVSGKGGDRSDQVFGGFVVPYSPEYLRFRSNRQSLQEIAERTSGEILSEDPTDVNIYERGRQVKRSTRPIFDWFLIALTILVPVDVGLRRVQLDWSTIKSLFVADRRQGPATATMGALLERKQAVLSELQQRKEEQHLPPPKPVPPVKSGPPPVAGPKPPPTAAPPGDKPASTTARLLQLKRKRDEEQK